MPKITIKDIEMYYEIHGTGEPIIFIGGFSVDHTAWLDVIERFKDSYQVVLFDNRGAGQTSAPKNAYTIEQMAEDVVSLCKKLNIKQSHFIGNSMGGFILQTLAYKHPNLVKTAIISNSTYTINSCFHYYVSAQFELLKANAPLSALIKASCCWAFSFQFLSQPGMLERLIQLTLNNPYPFTLTGYEGQYAALDKFNSSDWVNQIKVPTLIISGDQDLIFREPLVKSLAEKIPNANYYCFKNCGHLPYLEYPDQFAKVVKEFIA